jgi:DNA-binding transcriptional ArsR family regulator
MDSNQMRRFGDILKDKNIILKGADAATRGGFTQVPNFLLTSKQLSSGDKMTFAMLLSYAWQNNYCFPGQQRLADDLGLDERSVRRHLKALEGTGLLTIKRRGQGKTNIYELNLKRKRADRTNMSSLDRRRLSAPGRTRSSGTL